MLHHSAGAWHWTSDTYPADAISLRSITSDNFVVVDTTAEPKVIAEVDFPSALTTLHEKAIYLHEARQYQVEKFDYEGRKAYVRRVESRLLHGRDRLYPGEGAGGVRIRPPEARAPLTATSA